MELQAVRDIQRVLREYANNLESIIRSGITLQREAVLRASMLAARRMDAALARAVAGGRGLSFAETIKIWERAMAQVANLEGIPFSILGTVRLPPITMLGQFAGLQAGNHWRSIIRINSVSAGREASQIILAATQAGVGGDELARRLRRYVTGAEPFLEAFEDVQTTSGKVAKIDLRKLTKEERGAARRMVHSARRIAVSELHNARAEAEIQHMALDPFIGAIEWTLSPNRGFGPGSGFMPPDECDYLASNDIWGLGPGIYPVGNVPPPPHPFDRSLASWTPVLTRSGWKPVSDVSVGEAVLTHRGRWCEVTESIEGRLTDGWLRVATEHGPLTVTDDHPILLRDGLWILAGDLVAGDVVVGCERSPHDHCDEFGGSRPVLGIEATAVEDEKRPALLSKVRGLAGVLVSFYRRVVPTSVNLDGKTDVWDRDVDVPPIQGPQGLNLHTRIVHGLTDLLFVPRNVLLILVDRVSYFDALLDALGAPREESASMGCGSLAFSGVVLKSENRGFARSTPCDAVPHEVARYQVPARVENLSDTILGQLPFHVQVLQILGIQERPGFRFRESVVSHVERLPIVLRRYCLVVAKDNSFVAAGMIVHNCEKFPVQRGRDQIALPKPTGVVPSRASVEGGGIIPGEDRISPVRAERIREHAWSAVSFGVQGYK